MLWLAALAALSVVAIVLWWLASRKEAAAPAVATAPSAPVLKAASVAPAPPTAKPSTPPAATKPHKEPEPPRPAAPAPNIPKIPRVSDDDGPDVEITLVTLEPAALLDDAAGDAPAAQQPNEAVKIVYDEDAEIDEPTRVDAFILVSAAGLTDQGRKRRRNEDSLLTLDQHSLYAIADGMGGYQGGEVASATAVETLERAFRDQKFAGAPYPNVPRRGSELALAIQMANAAIFEKASADPERSQMGTTLVAARFSPNKQRLYIGHVGDSRCYRLRGDELRQMTVDHNMASEGYHGPGSQHLSRAVGVGASVKVDLILAKPRAQDLYLLCSDGLSKMLSDDRIREILIEEKDLQPAVDRLIAEANAAGGKDNVTVILVRVLPVRH